MDKTGEDMLFPRYQHTCQNCEFLGIYEDYDLYFCSQGARSVDSAKIETPTVIARYGHDGCDYHSGLTSSLDCLKAARNRAWANGFLKEAPKEYCNLHGSYSASFDKCPRCRRESAVVPDFSQEDIDWLKRMDMAFA